MNKPETKDKKDQMQLGVGLQEEDNERQRELFVYNKLTISNKPMRVCICVCSLCVPVWAMLSQRGQSSGG